MFSRAKSPKSPPTISASKFGMSVGLTRETRPVAVRSRHRSNSRFRRESIGYQRTAGVFATSERGRRTTAPFHLAEGGIRSVGMGFQIGANLARRDANSLYRFAQPLSGTRNAFAHSSNSRSICSACAGALVACDVISLTSSATTSAPLPKSLAQPRGDDNRVDPVMLLGKGSPAKKLHPQRFREG